MWIRTPCLVICSQVTQPLYHNTRCNSKYLPFYSPWCSLPLRCFIFHQKFLQIWSYSPQLVVSVPLAQKLKFRRLKTICHWNEKAGLTATGALVDNDSTYVNRCVCVSVCPYQQLTFWNSFRIIFVLFCIILQRKPAHGGIKLVSNQEPTAVGLSAGIGNKH